MQSKLVKAAVIFALASVCSVAGFAMSFPFPSPSNCPVPCWSGADLGSKVSTCTKTNPDGCTHRCNVYSVKGSIAFSTKALAPSGSTSTTCYMPSECFIL